MISYLKGAQLATKTETLLALCIASALGIVATMAWARLTDKIGRRPVYLWVTAFGIPFGVIMFMLVNTGLMILIVATFVIAYGVCQNALAGAQGALVPRAVQRQHLCLGSLTGIPDLGRSWLHAVHHHPALRVDRLDGPGAAVQRLHGDRAAGGRHHPGDVGAA